MQAKEKADKAKKNYAAFGPQSFKSRSLQSFQKELERGTAGHLMPVFNAKEKVKSGQIRQEDIPYMQRGGNWDNSDIRGSKKIKWNEDDKKYRPSVGPGLDWSGMGARRAPSQKTTSIKEAPKPKAQKLFGMF